MKNNPLVSVIMPVFNGQSYLKEALNSILAQSYDDFEFIIINDGSTDNTGLILQSLLDKRVKIINHQTNLGIVRSLNDGILASKGTLIARMDADDVSHPERFRKQVEFLNKNRDYVAVGSFLKITDASNKLLFTIEPPTRDVAIKKFLLVDSCIAHGSVMMRKSMVVEVGMYDNDKKVKHAEDYDSFVKLAAKYKLANIPEYLYTRKEHKQTVSRINSNLQQKSARYISNKAKKIIPKINKPSISVLMPNYNNAKYIAEAIESVINQTFKDWELVIIDDGSIDQSVSIIKKYLNDPRIIFLPNPGNIGKIKSRLRLVKESIADIFCELDSDDIITLNALAVMYKTHLDNPNSGFIYSQFIHCDSGLNKQGLGFSSQLGVSKTNLHKVVASAFRTYKRSSYDQTAGFDVNLPGAEDIDLIYKIEEVTKTKFIDQPLYLYRHIAKTKKDIAIGLFSHAKAKYFAYIRRRQNGYINISFVMLFRQIVNLFLQILWLYI